MVTIRDATLADVDAVLAFWPRATLPSSTDDSAGVRALIEYAPGALIVAADEEGDIVGTVIAGWDGWRGTIYRLAVEAGRRREGIASALVDAAESWLRERGARRLHLIVDEGGGVAEAFWNAAGYQPTGQKRFVKTLR